MFPGLKPLGSYPNSLSLMMMPDFFSGSWRVPPWESFCCRLSAQGPIVYSQQWPLRVLCGLVSPECQNFIGLTICKNLGRPFLLKATDDLGHVFLFLCAFVSDVSIPFDVIHGSPKLFLYFCLQDEGYFLIILNLSSAIFHRNRLSSAILPRHLKSYSRWYNSESISADPDQD